MMESLYSPLDSSRNEIRLLEFRPGTGEEPLHGSLVTVSLHLHYNYPWVEWGEDYQNAVPSEEPTSCPDHHPAYEALSYEWGSQASKSIIIIGQQDLTITSNLAAVLRQLRDPNKTRVLWIDAICINQVDLQERSSQVQRMTAIYQRANRVLIWLGEASHDSDLAIDTLARIGGKDREFSVTKFAGAVSAGPHFGSFRGTWPFEYKSEASVERLPDFTVRKTAPEWLQKMFDENKRQAEELSLIGVDSLNEQEWAALKSFFTERTWWKRVWVIQEIAHARDARIFCGTKSLQWDTLHDLWRHESSHRSVLLRQIMGHSAMKLDQMRGQVRNPMRALGFEPISSSLLCLLVTYRSWKSTDMRDKVYALQGLASISRHLPIQPNYERDPVDVFTEVARFLIREDGNLDILSQIHRMEDDERDPSWPSWIVDWSKHTDVRFLIDIENGLRPYDAGGPWTASYSVFAPDIGGNLRGGWRTIDKIVHPDERILDGLIRRQKEASQSEDDARVMTVNGILWDGVAWTSDSISKESLQSGYWKEHVRQWAIDVAQNLPTDEGPDIGIFMKTLLRGIFIIPLTAKDDGDLRTRCVEYLVEKFKEWMEYTSSTTTPAPVENMRVDFDTWIWPNLYGWKICTTDGGSFGLVPAAAKVGDVISVVIGSSVPLVLRKSDVEPEMRGWVLVGAAYFYHIMAGEVVQTYIRSLRSINLL